VLFASPATARERAEECASQAEHGQELQGTGRLVSALVAFHQCALDECPKVVREDCRAAILEIREKAPRLFLRVRDPSGADVVDATVTLDDQPLHADDLARGRIVDPGVHVVRASTTADVVEKRVLVATTDRERIVELVVADRGDSRPQPREGTTGGRTVSFILGGLGLGLLTTSGIVGATALSDYRTLEGRCGSSCRADDVSSIQGRIVATDVLLGAGLLSVAAAVVVWFTAPQRSP